jgi:tetratricopeptide (TPR) repeat protein
MSKVILFLALVLYLSSTTVAQAKQSGADGELLEANKLTRDIVKLYGERKLVEAIEIAKRVIKIRQNKLGPNDLLVGASIGNLAVLHLADDDFLNAEKAFRQSLDIYYKNGPKGEPAAAKTLDWLAHTAFVSRQFDKAEGLYRRAVDLKAKAFGVNHPEYIHSLKELIAFYGATGANAKAANALNDLITIRAKVFGENSRDVARLRLRLACFKYKNNEHAEAVKIESDANHILYQEGTTVATPVTLSEELFDCKLLIRPKPDFGNRRLSGNVVVEIEIDESGNVAAAKMISGEPIFEVRTLKAALKAKLIPTFIEGQPVKAKGLLTYSFRARPPLVVEINGQIFSTR